MIYSSKKKFAPNSYLSTLAFWISVVFLEHTISFWEALMRKTLSGKKRWRVSSTQSQIIFALFALDLLARTSHVVPPDYGAKQEILHVLCRNRGWNWLISWILYWFCFVLMIRGFVLVFILLKCILSLLRQLKRTDMDWAHWHNCDPVT